VPPLHLQDPVYEVSTIELRRKELGAADETPIDELRVLAQANAVKRPKVTLHEHGQLSTPEDNNVGGRLEGGGLVSVAEGVPH